MTYITFLIRKNKKKDIATFEHYKSEWDNIIFKLIELGKTDCFDIQQYFKNESNEWAVFLDTLAYFGYVDFTYPNLTIDAYSNYAIRNTTITKEEFENIVKTRTNNVTEIITYNTVLDTLNNNLISLIKKLLPLVNCDNANLSQQQETLIYNHIAKDLVYSTQNDTHFNINELESYINDHPISSHSSYYCKVVSTDNIDNLNNNLPASVLCFCSCKSREFYTTLLNKIMTDCKTIELLSLSFNKTMQNNYQLLIIYPNK